MVPGRLQEVGEQGDRKENKMMYPKIEIRTAYEVASDKEKNLLSETLRKMQTEGFSQAETRSFTQLLKDLVDFNNAAVNRSQNFQVAEEIDDMIPHNT